MPYETILYEKENGVVTITLNRPERLNAISAQLLRELDQAVDEVERDEEVKVFIITGAPRPDGRPCFSAGFDLKEAAERGPEAQLTILDRVEDLPRFIDIEIFDKIDALGKPSIAAIDGVCTAGSLALALSCDMRVVSETAQIMDLEIKNVGSFGATVPTKLPRVVGLAKAKEIMFTGDPVDGNEAVRIGLANKVFPPDKMLQGAKELANKVAQRRAVAVRMAKAAINASEDMEFAQSHRYSYLCAAAMPPSGGAKAFIEKRRQDFKD